MMFFFDTDDSQRKITDNLGIELAGEGEAVEQAVSLLRDMSHVEIAPGGARHMRVRVRGADGRGLYVASLDLRVEALG